MHANMMRPLVARLTHRPPCGDVKKGLTSRVKKLPFLDGCTCERCAALVKIAAGQSPRQVALGGLGRRRKPATVRAWLAAYRVGGLAGLAQRPRGHRGFSPSAGRAAGRDGAAAA